MLTNEKVFEVFEDYLKRETQYEVVLTRRGYILLAWENTVGGSATVEYCGTPEDLRDALLGSCKSLLEYEITHADRDLTDDEESQIKDKLNVYREKCR